MKFWKKTSVSYKTTKEVLRGIIGFNSYEKHVQRLIRNGKDKKALKIARKKLGSMKRGKKKRELINEIARKD